ncbi:glycosyltransferase family 2 protein [Emcibacteraceae bacterium]|nr:glycosyltransferase family 2 protein [Emcibacteraceae bacterium]
MTNSKITILVLIYNNQEYVESCIESIIAANGSDNVDIIVIDDCSNDKSVEVVENFIAHNNVQNLKLIINEENLGINKSLAKGLGEIKTEYVKFIAGDDEFEPHALSVYNDCIESERPDFIMSNLNLISAEGDYIGVKMCMPPKLLEINFFREVNMYVNEVTAPSICVKTDVFIKALKETTTRNAEDWPLLRYVIVNNLKISLINEFLIKYRLHSASLSNSFFTNNLPKKLKNDLLQIYKENYIFCSSVWSKFGVKCQVMCLNDNSLVRCIGKLGKFLNFQYLMYRVFKKGYLK